MPWYSAGLHFKCTGCGKCCTGAPGFVFVDEEEMTKMADFLALPLPLFKRKFTRLRERRFALVEVKTDTPNEVSCVFLKDNKCSVYAARPKQCRTFPWWPENLSSEKSWELAAKNCEGIDKDAPLVPFEEIDSIIL